MKDLSMGVGVWFFHFPCLKGKSQVRRMHTRMEKNALLGNKRKTMQGRKNMGTREVLKLFGGFALFLYGRQMMCGGLETAVGNRMRQVMEKLTTNPFLGLAAGAVITAMIQSSSATVLMAVGFVGSGIITLQQAVWIVLGANIGTTLTGQLIAWQIGVIAPLFIFAGVILAMFRKENSYVCAGEILAGLGVFFMGMEMMKEAMSPLQGSMFFGRCMGVCTNPFLGVGVGVLIAVILQSSAVSVGILQVLAVSGWIGFEEAVFVLFGQNIGTCINVIIASSKGAKTGRRVTWIHLLFNITGTILFTILCTMTPLLVFLERLTPSNSAAQVANIHTLFNAATAVLLFPAAGALVEVTRKILPEENGEERSMSEKYLKYLSPKGQFQGTAIGTSAIYFNQLRQEIMRMLQMAQYNVDKAFWAFRMADEEPLAEINETEQYIDYLNKEISGSISRRVINESNERDTKMASQYFQMTGNVERIGDHALKIAEYIRILRENEVRFSREAHREMEQMEQVLQVTFEALERENRGSAEWMMRLARLEHDINDMTIQFRKAHMDRIKQGICSEEACIVYSEMLTDFERIGDHALDIAQEMLEMDMIEGDGYGADIVGRR